MLINLTKIYHYGCKITPNRESIIVNMDRVELMGEGIKKGGYENQKEFTYTTIIFSTHNVQVKESINKIQEIVRYYKNKLNEEIPPRN